MIKMIYTSYKPTYIQAVMSLEERLTLWADESDIIICQISHDVLYDAMINQYSASAIILYKEREYEQKKNTRK